MQAPFSLWNLTVPGQSKGLPSSFAELTLSGSQRRLLRLREVPERRRIRGGDRRNDMDADNMPRILLAAR